MPKPFKFDSGLPKTIDGSEVSTNRGPIPLDALVPIDGEIRAYLEGRTNFYVALLEELIRRGADRGDIYFMKDCVDALLKMTTVGRAKVDVNLGGGISKLRDEIDFSAMSKEEIDAFLARARGELNVRADDTISLSPNGGTTGLSITGREPGIAKPRRRRKAGSNNTSQGQAQGQNNNSGSGGSGGSDPVGGLHSLSHSVES